MFHTVYRKQLYQYGLLFLAVVTFVAIAYLAPIQPDHTAADHIASEIDANEMDVVAVSGGILTTTTVAPRLDAFRQARLQGRSKQIEMIQQVLQDDHLSVSERAELIAYMFEIVGRSENERELEAWLLARGIDDAIVYAREHVAEILLTDAMTMDEVSRVGQLVSGTFGIPLERITVVDGIGR